MELQFLDELMKLRRENLMLRIEIAKLKGFDAESELARLKEVEIVQSTLQRFLKTTES